MLEIYPYTFSNFLKLQLRDKDENRARYFRTLREKMNFADKKFVVAVRKGRQGQSGGSEIWFTPAGFFRAFNYSHSPFAKAIMILKDTFMELAFDNIAARNMSAKHKDLQIEQQRKQITQVTEEKNRLIDEKTRTLLLLSASEKKEKDGQISAYKYVMRLLGITHKNDWMDSTPRALTTRFWQVWNAVKERGLVTQALGEDSSCYQLTCPREDFANIVRQLVQELCPGRAVTDFFAKKARK